MTRAQSTRIKTINPKLSNLHGWNIRRQAFQISYPSLFYWSSFKQNRVFNISSSSWLIDLPILSELCLHNNRRDCSTHASGQLRQLPSWRISIGIPPRGFNIVPFRIIGSGLPPMFLNSKRWISERSKILISNIAKFLPMHPLWPCRKVEKLYFLSASARDCIAALSGWNSLASSPQKALDRLIARLLISTVVPFLMSVPSTIVFSVASRTVQGSVG